MFRTVPRVSMGILAALVIGMSAGSASLAGELEPPVPPGTPTMKPLDEIEPRRPIHAEMLPLDIGDWGTSWYLAENIYATTAGITVSARNVTIDLMGFELAGDWGNGPGIGGTGEDLTVRNGTIRGWDKGLDLDRRAIVTNVRVNESKYSCIELGFHSMITDSMGSVCGHHGIVVDVGSTVSRCSAVGNAQNGIWSTWYDGGILTYHGTLITDCVVESNLRNGIRVDGHAFVARNHIRGNDAASTMGKAGIWVFGEGNRIEANHIAYNSIGVDLDGHDNIIIKNSLIHNVSAAYATDASAIGNVFEIGTGPTAGPWANFCKGTGCPP